jgi:hypothetical protein
MSEQSNKVQLGVITADLQAPSRTREDALLECDRELSVRVRCFPDWVKAGKLSMGDGRTRLESMARACQLLSVVHQLTDEQWTQVEAMAELNTEQQQNSK